MKNLLLATSLMLAASGCYSYSHERVGIEKTHVWGFVYMGNASKIRAATKDSTNYSRTVSVGEISGAVDGNAIEKTFEGAGAAFGKGLKAAVAP